MSILLIRGLYKLIESTIVHSKTNTHLIFAEGVKYNNSVDWWSFGVLLYEMLIGKSPFTGADEDELLWNVCNERIVFPLFLSKEAVHIIALLLNRNPDKRLGRRICSKFQLGTEIWKFLLVKNDMETNR